MKTRLNRHVPFPVWEEYAMGRLSEEDCAPVEEHLLICAACQDVLAEADEYIEIAKTALTRATRGEGARRLSKRAAAAGRNSGD
jgi:hypothetical protein